MDKVKVAIESVSAHAVAGVQKGGVRNSVPSVLREPASQRGAWGVGKLYDSVSFLSI